MAVTVAGEVEPVPSTEVLPEIIDTIQARGLRVVTVSELLGLAPGP